MPRPFALTLAAILAAAFLAGAAPATHALTPFAYREFDSGGYDQGEFAKLQFAPDGTPHILYWDDSWDDLYHAWYANGAWSTQVIDYASVGAWISFRIDESGVFHAAYKEFSNGGQLRYARSTNGLSWTVVVADSGGPTNLSVGDGGSLAFSGGYTWITHYDATNGDLRLTKLSGTVPQSSTTLHASANNLGLHTQLVNDADGNLHCTYYDATTGNLLYARKLANSATWTFETVDASANDVGAYNSLALDPTGAPCVAYFDDTADDLRYARRIGGVWTPEVADYGIVGAYASLAFDPSGDPAIAYQELGNLDQKLARKQNGGWTSEVTDGVAASTGLWNSLAFDRWGNPWIAGYDESLQKLRLANGGILIGVESYVTRYEWGQSFPIYWQGTGPVDVELSTDLGTTWQVLRRDLTEHFVSIPVPLVEAGDVRVRIHRASPEAYSTSPVVLAFAPPVTNRWAVEPLPVWTSDMALAIDDAGRPQIVTSESGTIRWLRREGGTWRNEAVSAGNGTSQYPQIAVGDDGEPRLAWQRGATGDLYYARRSGGNWTVEAVDTAGYTGGRPRLALDAGDRPMIVYSRSSPAELRLARRLAAGWAKHTVDTPGVNGPSAEVTAALDGSALVACRTQFGDGVVIDVDTLGNAFTFDYGIPVDTGGWWVMKLRRIASGLTETACITPDQHLAIHLSGTVDAKVITSASALLAAGEGPDGEWRLIYFDPLANSHMEARETDGTWTLRPISVYPAATAWDAYGSLHTLHDFMWTTYVTEGLLAGQPAAGSVWPVGAERVVTWLGQGAVDVELSPDGGATWQPIARSVSGGSLRLRVPHLPTRFARVRVTRAEPFAQAVSESLFTIQSSVALLAFTARPAGEQGVALAWNTDPAPEDLAGYRLERRAGGPWETAARLGRVTEWTDPAAGASGYRLFAVNGLGAEILLGEASLAPARPLAAWPLPYRGGDLNVSFGVAAIGDGTGDAEVALFDVGGRRVRTLTSGARRGGYHQLAWDGRDDAGARVAPGLYFLRSAGAGGTHQLKLVVMP